MKKRILLFFWLSILFVITLACTLPTAIPTSTPVIDINATFTSIALSQFALQTPSTPILPSAILPPTQVATLPTSVPVVTVSVDTNCRTGPGASFDYLSALLVGEQAEVVGRYTSANPGYWIIKKDTVTCWLWGKYATVEGDTNGLPEIMPPPPPTPSPTASPSPTAIFTQTASPVPQPPGDLVLIEFFQLTNHNIAVRVGVDPVGSLSGNYVYTVWADGSKVKEATCAIPTGSALCDTGYPVSGTQVIEVVIDTNNLIWETSESNNIMFLTCAPDWTCK